MLRPATPLSILLFIAFILLLLSVISTPIVKAIPLAAFRDIEYGVFGYCQGNDCTGPKVGYNTDSDADFSLSASTRHSLSAILIVHPIAALLTLICFILSCSAHLHSPSHSPKFLLALIILLLPTLLITLLAFLVDILLFVPHLGWGGWIVLAATILIVASGIVTCAMRRTLVSRKARKKRIAENAEMNGDNFYARQNTQKAESPPSFNQQPTAPMVNGAPASDKLPSFATFDAHADGHTGSDDQIPLKPVSSSNRTAPSTASGFPSSMSDDGMDRYGGPGRGGPGGMRGGRGGYNGPRDEFGNPLPPSAAFGPGPPGQRRNSGESRMRRQYSNETMNSQGSRGRGRGGYPPRGYGRGGPYGGGRGGPPGMNGNGRGIPMGAMATGAGAGMLAGEMGRGQRGPPPGYANGYPPQGRDGPAPYNREMSPAGYGMPGPNGRRPSPPNGEYGMPGPNGRRPSPSNGEYGRQQSPGPPSAPGYGRQRSPGPPSAPGYGYGGRGPSPGPPSAPGYGYGGREPSPGPVGQRFPQNSPPPPLPMEHLPDSSNIGQAVEMDASTGSPSQILGHALAHPLRDSNVQGFVGLQQGRVGSPLRHEDPISPASMYSGPQDTYIPPRAAWSGGPGRNNTPPINTNSQPLSPIHQSPVELPAQAHSPPPQHQPLNFNPPTHTRSVSGDHYYEDVDPRFADPEPPQTQSSVTVPALLMPGHLDDASNPPHHMQNQPIDRDRPVHDPRYLEPASSYEFIQQDSRSPAVSEESNFTSISQRGVNPDWRPPPPGQGPYQGSAPGQGHGNEMGMGGVPNRKPMTQQRDMLLAGNPDFELPGMSSGGRGGGGVGVAMGGRGPYGGTVREETAYMGNAI